jgi:uncharacterized membrane protein YeaQ/YmgE (transglycosylase-associated protein family)
MRRGLRYGKTRSKWIWRIVIAAVCGFCDQCEIVSEKKLHVGQVGSVIAGIYISPPSHLIGLLGAIS